MDRRRALMSVHMGTNTPIAPPEPIIDINNYLTIESLESLSIIFNSNGCEYCVNGDGNWITYNANKIIEIPRRRYVSFRGNLIPNADIGIGSFYISGKCNLKGNCMSMLFGDNAVNNFSLSGKSFAFYQLFYNCTNIVSVSKNFLPAITLAHSCYYAMFYGCTSLTTAPELPATTLARECYSSMFRNCTSLTTAPELPATTLALSCYYSMFRNCTSLTTAPELPAITLAHSCYYAMFYGCVKLNYIKMLATTLTDTSLTDWVAYVASSGTFVKNPNMASLPTGINGIPSGWTVQNA